MNLCTATKADALPRRRTARRALAVVFVALCLTPMALRVGHPSLYSDDVVRIAQLRTAPSLAAVLFTPFNEHMAPAFQAVTRATWSLAGERLAVAPLAFTIVSALPHLLCLVALGGLVQRESGSSTAAMGAVALFGLSGAISETYHWYSASSFSWALLGTLVALDASARAAGATAARPRAGWIMVAAVASAIAPAFSGIGLLAGPVAALRLALAAGVGRSARLGSLLPPVGTAVYLGVCSVFRYGDVLAASLAANVDVPATLRNLGRAPADVLLPALVGLREQGATIPNALAIAASAVLLVAALIGARLAPARRATILASLALIAGGYTLAFGLRSGSGSPVGIGVQRYQLLPMAGLALLIAVTVAPALRRLDARPIAGPAAATAFAAGILVIQFGTLRENGRFFLWPSQRPTLAAIERLAETCRREGITRSQCLGALPPVRKGWFDHDGFNALDLLPSAAPAAQWSDAEASARVVASLGAGDREALCGGMEVGRRLRTPAELGGGDAVAVGALVRSSGVEDAGRPDGLRATGFASYLEFQMAGASADEMAGARVLVVPAAGPVEVWWADESGRFTEGRSVRWRPAPSGVPVDHAVALADLPHWDPTRVRRIRVAPRKAGLVASAGPRLLR